MANQQKQEIKYPENLWVFAAIKHWEKKILSLKTGYGVPHLCHVAKGRRRMNDKIKRAIIEMKQEQQQLNQAMEQAVAQE